MLPPSLSLPQPAHDYVTRYQFDLFLTEETIHHQRQEADIKSIMEKQDKDHKFLFGNGEPGMDEMMRMVVEYVKSQKIKNEADETERSRSRNALRNQMYGLMAATVVNLLLSIFLRNQ